MLTNYGACKKILIFNPIMFILSIISFFILDFSYAISITGMFSFVSIILSFYASKNIKEKPDTEESLIDKDQINEIIDTLDNNASTFKSSFSVLVSASDDVLSKTKESSEKTDNISAKTHHINSSISSISNTMDNSSSNVNLIAAAIEEMSATINEISVNTGNAKNMTESAFTEVERTSSNMEKLDREVEKIGNVTETISEISEQTNLLALNATIEAARAGEYGKGFAVVANEIKELAKQTAEATLEIKKKIDGIQQTTQMTVNDAGSVIKSIEEIGEIISVIAVAIEEQTSTTNEISENILKAAKGVNDVNDNLSSSTDAMLDIENEINDLNKNHKVILEKALEQNLISKEVEDMVFKLSELSDKYSLKERLFSIGEIKKAHLNWRIKLESALKGYKEIKTDQLVDHHNCDLGKWYDSSAHKFEGSTTFRDLGNIHKDVHDKIHKIVELKQSGNDAEAEKHLSSFEESRIQLFQKLDQLYTM